MNQGNAVETFPSPIEADSQNQFKELIEIIAQSVKCEYALCIGHEFPLPSFLATAKCPEELILAYKARNYQSIAENLPINDETLPCPYIIKKIYSAEQQLIATLVLIKPADANFIVSSNSFVNLFCKHIELLHENSVLRGEGKKLHLDYNTLNRKYELIVKAFIKPCIVISTSLHIIAFNSIAATLYKHALNLTLKEGEDFIKYVVPGRLQSFMDNMKAVISGNEKSRELQFLDPYFNKWWMIVYTPIMGSDNQIEAISIFFRNITNEKFVEKQFEEISDVARVGGWEYDIKNKSLYLTQVAKENFGIDKQNHPSLSEVYGYFYSTASKHVIKSAFTSLIKHGKEFDEELQIVKSNGEVIWVRIKAKAEIFNDKPTRAYGTFQDIDSKRLIYEELLHNQLYLKSLFEYNPYAIFSLNMDGKFINANQSMAELAGTTVENLLKQNDYTHFFEKSELPKLHQNFIKVKKKDPISFETTAVTYKGAVKYINLTFVPIIINNDIEAVYGIARDITE
ncbi:MAG: PAS domain S-box protein, partial [Chitinophagia bacterium]|nr:PAS domain S-box protein [Chitinophagia bacterium]